MNQLLNLKHKKTDCPHPLPPKKKFPSHFQAKNKNYQKKEDLVENGRVWPVPPYQSFDDVSPCQLPFRHSQGKGLHFIRTQKKLTHALCKVVYMRVHFGFISKKFDNAPFSIE